MKFKKITFLSILMLFIFKASFCQSPNIYESTNALKDFLDKRSYIVPDYGTIRFDFNNILITKKSSAN